MHIQYRPESKTGMFLLLALLAKNGFTGGDFNPDDIQSSAEKWWKYYPYINIHDDGKDIGGNLHPRPDYQNVSLEDFVRGVNGDWSNQPIEVQLNNQYTARVSKSEITVGCQTFSFAAFDKLAQAVKKMRKA